MTLHGVTIRRVQALRGPNLHAYKPVLRVELDIGPFEERLARVARARVQHRCVQELAAPDEREVESCEAPVTRAFE